MKSETLKQAMKISTYEDAFRDALRMSNDLRTTAYVDIDPNVCVPNHGYVATVNKVEWPVITVFYRGNAEGLEDI